MTHEHDLCIIVIYGSRDTENRHCYSPLVIDLDNLSRQVETTYREWLISRPDYCYIGR